MVASVDQIEVIELGEMGLHGAGISAAQLADIIDRLDTLETDPVYTGTLSGVSANFSGNVAAGNSASDTLTAYRIATAGNVPALAAGAAMGTSPGAQTKTGNDTNGTIIQNVGTSPAAGVLWAVTFATPRALSTFNVHLSRLGTNAADANLYVTNRTVNGFDIGCRTAPTASVQIAVGWTVLE